MEKNKENEIFEEELAEIIEDVNEEAEEERREREQKEEKERKKEEERIEDLQDDIEKLKKKILKKKNKLQEAGAYAGRFSEEEKLRLKIKKLTKICIYMGLGYAAILIGIILYII